MCILKHKYILCFRLTTFPFFLFVSRTQSDSEMMQDTGSPRGTVWELELPWSPRRSAKHTRSICSNC